MLQKFKPLRDASGRALGLNVGVSISNADDDQLHNRRDHDEPPRPTQQHEATQGSDAASLLWASRELTPATDWPPAPPTAESHLPKPTRKALYRSRSYHRTVPVAGATDLVPVTLPTAPDEAFFAALDGPTEARKLLLDEFYRAHGGYEEARRLRSAVMRVRNTMKAAAEVQVRRHSLEPATTKGHMEQQRRSPIRHPSEGTLSQGLWQTEGAAVAGVRGSAHGGGARGSRGSRSPSAPSKGPTAGPI
jgi:hypothetical protein